MEIKEITIEEAKTHLENNSAKFFDIRDPRSYETAHIEGAKHLSDQNIQEFVANEDKSQTYIIYCYHGHSSMSACAFLMDNGFENVFSMSGGYTQWAASEN